MSGRYWAGYSNQAPGCGSCGCLLLIALVAIFVLVQC